MIEQVLWPCQGCGYSPARGRGRGAQILHYGLIHHPWDSLAPLSVSLLFPPPLPLSLLSTYSCTGPSLSISSTSFTSLTLCTLLSSSQILLSCSAAFFIPASPVSYFTYLCLVFILYTVSNTLLPSVLFHLPRLSLTHSFCLLPAKSAHYSSYSFCSFFY